MNISKRNFLRSVISAPMAMSFANEVIEVNAQQKRRDPPSASRQSAATAPQSSGPHKLPSLPYGFAALEPHIDRATMELHHGKHHAAYVNNLNAALAKHSHLQNRSAEDLIRNLQTLPEDVRTTIRNNAGGHVNHTMFWQIMRPGGGGEPSGAIADAVKSAFGSFANFKTKFNEEGTKRFGSGWVWLVRDGGGALQVISTPNQDNPLMEGHIPIMGNDVWEHAYYLKYNNRRADYLAAWWNTVNWEEINRRFSQMTR